MTRGIRLRVAVLGVLSVFGNCGLAGDVPKEEPVLLMGMLQEWLYPGAKFHGAESSSAAVSGITAIKNKSALTTADSAEKVLAYYCEKLNVDAEGMNLGKAKEGDVVTGKRSVLIQDNSVGRPLKLYIIAINEAGSSTTLVISRSEGEETTHIAWSNFRKLGPS